MYADNQLLCLSEGALKQKLSKKGSKQPAVQQDEDEQPEGDNRAKTPGPTDEVSYLESDLRLGRMCTTVFLQQSIGWS